jgi:uncharacterized protein (TIGR00251 family)
MREIKKRSDGRLGFRVRVQPSASKSELLGWNPAGELRVKVAAPAREDAANKKLAAFLAKRLSVPRSEIIIESGGRSRLKTLSVPAEAVDILRELPTL